MLRKLKLFIIGAFWMLGSTAFADQDCSQINTNEFARNLDVKLLKICAQQGEVSLFEMSNRSESIFLQKVIRSTIISNDIDSVANNSSSDSWFRQLGGIDSSGKSTLQIAVEEARTPEVLLRLLAFDRDESGRTNLDDFDLLAHSLSLEGREDYAAVLIALGQVAITESYASSAAKALANPGAYSPKIDPRALKRSETCADSPSDLVRDPFKEAQHNYCAAQVYAKDPLKTDPYGNTFLHSAIKAGFGSEFIDTFLSNIDEEEGGFFDGGTDNRDRVLASTNVEGFTALGIAAKFSKNPNVITHLIGWGADPNAPQGKVRKQNLFNKIALQNPKADRSLHFAALRTDDLRFKMMLRLLAGGASPQSQDTKGNTALHLLLRKSDAQYTEITFDEIALLLHVKKPKQWHSKADDWIKTPITDIYNDAGATPLHLAVARGLDKRSFIEFLKYGANPDELTTPPDNDGSSPAPRSALFDYGNRGNDPDVFRMLLDASENACKVSVRGNSLQAVLASNTALRETKTAESEFAMSLFKKKCL